MSFTNAITENIVLPLGDLITGQSVASKLRFLQASQWWTREQIDAYQNEHLKFIIRHAYATVPYYQDLFNSLKITPEDIRCKNDLKKLPLLTKEIIKQEGTVRFTSDSVPARKRIKKSSGGSTGVPLLYYTSRDAYSLNIAANLRGWYWMGFRLGDKYVKLSQNPRKNPIKRLQDRISKNLYLSTSPLMDENFKSILGRIEDYKPVVIRSNPDPLLFLARFKKQHSDFSYSPRMITTTGATLFPKTREEIEQAFGCKIYDTYSCEGNSNFFECPTHTGYHSAEEYGISEILDDNENPVKSGVGRLISTDLWNLAHPFIRYDTGDLVEIDTKECECHRTHLKIKRILGRSSDAFTRNNRKFIFHHFTVFFSRRDLPCFGTVERFQIINQKARVLFNLVVNQNFNEAISSFIRTYWQKEMQTTVEIQIVEHIPLTESGKHQLIINEE